MSFGWKRMNVLRNLEERPVPVRRLRGCDQPNKFIYLFFNPSASPNWVKRKAIEAAGAAVCFLPV